MVSSEAVFGRQVGRDSLGRDRGARKVGQRRAQLQGVASVAKLLFLGRGCLPARGGFGLLSGDVGAGDLDPRGQPRGVLE